MDSRLGAGVVPVGRAATSERRQRLVQHSIHRHAKHGGRPHSLPVSLPRRCSICLADETRPLPICVASHLPVWFCSEAAMLGGNEPQWTKPPKPVRRRGAQPAPELDARAAEMRLRQSSTKEETERIEEHLRLLRSVELSGPATPTWIAVTAYLILIVACATSRIASAAGLDAIVSTALAKVSRCQARHFRWRARAYSHSRAWLPVGRGGDRAALSRGLRRLCAPARCGSWPQKVDSSMVLPDAVLRVAVAQLSTRAEATTQGELQGIMQQGNVELVTSSPPLCTSAHPSDPVRTARHRFAWRPAHPQK